MNMDGAFDTYWQQPAVSASQIEDIGNALQATLNPRISNEVRQEVLQHLEHFKTLPDAPEYGFKLADDWKHDDAIRYYGLQLLEHAVRYKWSDFSPAQTEQLRTWVKCLAGSLRAQDATFIRNKVAQLWVDLAKRCWGEEWMDMDQLLVKLWETPMKEKGSANKLFVLYVLEALSDDILLGEDAIAGVRSEILGASLNDIMVPQALYEHAKMRTDGQEVRSAHEGWVTRVCSYFADCVEEVRMGGSPERMEDSSMCAVKALNALRPTLSWISLKAVVLSNVVDCLYLPFHLRTNDLAMQIAATETMYALLSRPYHAHWHDAWSIIHQQALPSDRIALIREAFERTTSAPGEDDSKHMLQKKMSEVLSILADALAHHPQTLAHADDLDPPAFFDLLAFVLQSKSLVVSIPVLHSWNKMMSVQDPVIIDLVYQALYTLVQTCSERLFRYESIVSDSDDEIVQFLDEDFDTVPERHAFLGNYRRYCVSIIQSIASSRPLEALQHVLEQMRSLLENGPYTGGRGFSTADYSRNSIPVLRFDAQFNVVSSALKGFSLWRSDVLGLTHEDTLHAKAESDRTAAEQALQEWSHHLMNIHVDDPEVAAQVLETLIMILRAIKARPDFVLQVVQHVLTMRLYDNPSHTAFSDAVKAFENLRVMELQKLALAHPNELLEVYHELEPRIGVLVQKHSDDAKITWPYKAFLFMIVHRASSLSDDVRMARLQQMLSPVSDAWKDQTLIASVKSLQGFCRMLGLGDLAEFYKAHGFDQTSDWAGQNLDESGQLRQKDIKDANDGLPLRMTKVMLAAATEKVKPGTDEYSTAYHLWAGIIPVILPSLLQMLRYAQAFHDMSNWSQLPDELQWVVKRTLQDRFWQSGISHESKEEFYNRVSGSRTSFEGFASIVRGSMRNVREQGYNILFLMTKFDGLFYALPDLAVPLAEALFANADVLPANHLHPVINLATCLVQRCPPKHRLAFLPPLLTRLFTKLDAKISSDWAVIDAAIERNASEDQELGDEMRLESVLRQLTYSMVSFVAFLLEFEKQQPIQHQGIPTNGHSDNTRPPSEPTLSNVILADPAVLEPLMLFCTHALRMRDTRCCVTICKVFRSVVPFFQSDNAPAPQVREFISTEVLKACITSLNEPYFTDVQKDLAMLIAQIILLYSRQTATPREILLSLPDMSAAKVDKAISRMSKTSSERGQRSYVLELLEGVRGVSIHEAGKIAREAPKKKDRSAMQQQFMEIEQRPAIVDGDENGLENVAGLFDET